VGELADDSVLVHDDLHRLFVRVRRPNFRQDRVVASQLVRAMRESRQPRCAAAI
jgi:hypothetical protein